MSLYQLKLLASDKNSLSSLVDNRGNLSFTLASEKKKLLDGGNVQGNLGAQGGASHNPTGKGTNKGLSLLTKEGIFIGLLAVCGLVWTYNHLKKRKRPPKRNQ